MAHDLFIERGTAAMIYVGDAPWHGLGQKLDSPPTAAEAIKAAHLDWRVVKKPLYAREGAISYRIPERYALVREDRWGQEDCPFFAQVSETYTPLQNSEAFSFFDPLIDSKVAHYETAGALGKGERVWVLAKLKESISIKKTDEVHRYILLSNGHDAATSVRILFTPIRVVCQNTLNWALQNTNRDFKAYHGRDLFRQLDKARGQLDQILAQYTELGEHFELMADKELVQGELKLYLGKVFPDPEPKKLSPKRYEQVRAEVGLQRSACAELFEAGRGNDQPGIKGTLWAAYNGVTEWADHGRDYVSNHQRFNSLMFGDSARIKGRALRSALEMIGVGKDAEADDD